MGKFMYRVELRLDTDAIDVTQLGEDIEAVEKKLHLARILANREQAINCINTFFDEFEKL